MGSFSLQQFLHFSLQTHCGVCVPVPSVGCAWGWPVSGALAAVLAEAALRPSTQPVTGAGRPPTRAGVTTEPVAVTASLLCSALVVLSLLRLRSLPFREFHGMNLGPAAPGSRVAARTTEVAGSVRGRLRAGDSGASSSVRLLAASGVPGAGLRPQGSPVARWQKALRASGAVPC